MYFVSMCHMHESVTEPKRGHHFEASVIGSYELPDMGARNTL